MCTYHRVQVSSTLKYFKSIYLSNVNIAYLFLTMKRLYYFFKYNSRLTFIVKRINNN